MKIMNRIVKSIKNLIVSELDTANVISKLKLYANQYFSQKAKNYFGREFYVFDRLSTDLKETAYEPVLKFFSSCIKEFDTKYLDHYGKLTPMIIQKIDTNTFVYIASDMFVPNRILVNSVRKGSDSHHDSLYDADTYVYFFGKKSFKYAKLFQKALDESKLVQQKKKIAIVNKLTYEKTDISTLSFDPRDVSTLVYSHGEIDVIKDHLNKFFENHSFYKSKQLLYKTGILLYGVPGTGKSTICKVLANLYQRNIIQVNVSTIEDINFGELTRLINNDDHKYIVLLEDIDTLYLNRDGSQVDKDYNKIINNLLQFLDSNMSPDDVIFIATTNHIDRLDEALLRSGRFDLKVEVKGILERDIYKMLDLFNLDHSLKKEVIDKYLESERYSGVKIYNQSKLQNILLQKIKYTVPMEQ